MNEEIRRRARELGFDDCRFTTAAAPESAALFEQWLAGGRHGEMTYLDRNACKRIDPNKVLPGAKTVIILAATYAGPTETRMAPGSGMVAAYARYEDYHHVLAARLKQLAHFINTLSGPEIRSLWYVDTGPLLERDLAQRAGLGFIGKHTNLISRRLGNWLFLSEIITTLELRPDAPQQNHCGSCARCIAACPTKAITAPFQLDARRCISYLTIELKGPIPEEFRAAIGNRIYGCDDCLAACPWNRFAQEGQLMKEYKRHELTNPDIVELLSIDEAEFKRKFAGTPILRAKRRGLLRNVCVALGNVGDQGCLAALEKATRDTEPLIAEHARWALQQVQRRLALSKPEGRSTASCADAAARP
jgi:epoxyqueuosine reductase